MPCACAMSILFLLRVSLIGGSPPWTTHLNLVVMLVGENTVFELDSDKSSASGSVTKKTKEKNDVTKSISSVLCACSLFGNVDH